MKLPVPDPREIVSLMPRLLRMVAEGERLLALVDEVVVRIELTRAAAADVVSRVDATAARADALVVLLEPAVVQLLPAIEQLAERVGPREVDRVVEVLDVAPELVGRVQRLLPVLDSLASVAPDLGDLLAASRELNELLGGLPGMGRVKKRVEEAHQDDAG